MFQINAIFYEDLVRELYYRDLRQLDGVNRDQEALERLWAYQQKSAGWKGKLRPLWAIMKLLGS